MVSGDMSKLCYTAYPGLVIDEILFLWLASVTYVGPWKADASARQLPDTLVFFRHDT